MAFPLSFADEFFYGTTPIDDIEETDRPTSVMQALVSMNTETWNDIARDVFGWEPEHVSIDEVLTRIFETDTCSDLSPPVEVWIDRSGFYTVLVYETDGE